MGEPNHEFNTEDYKVRYLLSLFWALQTLLSGGCERLKAKNNDELIFSVLVILLSIG